MPNAEKDSEHTRIPSTFGDLTPEHLALLLRRCGAIKDCKVEAVNIEPIAAGTGFVGRAAFLKMTYDHPESGAPDLLFAKLSSADASVRARFQSVGLYETEAGFYRDLSREMRIRVPRAYAAHYDSETGECLLLLESVGHMRLGDNLAGSTLEDARVAIQNLALMQAHYWNSNRLKQYGWLRSMDKELANTRSLYLAMIPVFEQRWGGEIPSAITGAMRMLGEFMEPWFDDMAASDFTLTHGDYRPDNFAFDESGRLVLFDWQTARRSANSRDLAYFMALSLPVEMRRAHEAELLELYRHSLAENGVRSYPMRQLWNDYRCSLGSALLTVVIAGAMLDFSDARSSQLHRAVWDRVNSAVDDHDYANWLPKYLRGK